MITRVLAVGLLAGLIAGLCVAVLQTVTTTPLILEAEVFEKADEAKAEGASVWYGSGRGSVASEARVILVHAEAHGATAGGAEEAWAPRDGLERTLYASTATIATAIGFALILLAGMLAARDPIDERRAIAWAAAGFVVTGLAPCLGLSPEVPGMAAADLVGRQEWWLATALATAVGLWLILRTDSILLRLLAVVILLAPHVWGAPHIAEEHVSSVPAHLAAQFAATSLAVQATLWLLTGFFVGFLWRRMGAGHGSQPT
jgi:cobalt transporter subunit CbtA